MTEQELRDKIIDILKESRKRWEIIIPSIGILDEPRIDIKISKIADALIAAGLTFDSEWKHRAEVAKRALMDMCEEYEDNFECDLYKECDSDYPCYLCDFNNRLNKAEKELKM